MMMEEPLVKFRNRLRNNLIIAYWVLIAFFAVYLMTYFDSIKNEILLLILSMFVVFFIWLFKILKIYIYDDFLVFKEYGLFPIGLKNVFGISFENIYDYKIKRIGFFFQWFILEKRDGKTIRRLCSLTQSELLQFSEILNENYYKNNDKI